MTFDLRVSGQTRHVDAPPDKPDPWVLREPLGLKGAKHRCGIGACGACAVHIDGQVAGPCVEFAEGWRTSWWLEPWPWLPLGILLVIATTAATYLIAARVQRRR